MIRFLKANILYFALVQAILATLGSLYFSEMRQLQPCVLCWYQRICMYPEIVIITVGILIKDKNIPKFILPLSLIGWVVAFYHNLLYYSIVPESFAPCTVGVSCTAKLIELLGFVTIPLLSLAAFTIINICMILSLKWSKDK